jgi:hypothetical protein
MVFDRKNYETFLFSCKIGSILHYIVVVVFWKFMYSGDYKGVKWWLLKAKLITIGHSLTKWKKKNDFDIYLITW